MSTQCATSDPTLAPLDADYAQYRSICGMSVMGLVFSVFGLASLLTPWLVVLPLAGTILSLRGWRAVRQRPAELTGARMALTGLVLGLSTVLASLGLHSWVYATEIPDPKFQRVNFSELQLARKPTDNHPLLPIPKRALEFDGKEIFIKGYVFPDGRTDGIEHFILVPDMGTCCFGGDPALADMIEVRLKEGLKTKYSYARRKLAGKFRLNLEPQPFLGKTAVYYLDAEYIR